MKALPLRTMAASLIAVIGFVACNAAPAATPRDADVAALMSQARQFLDAYAANDQRTALKMIDPQHFTMYGSDVAEIAHGSAGLRQFMDEDHRLWRAAKFGAIEHFDSRAGAEYASAFFDVPFSVGGAAPVPVRVSTVWHKVGSQWLLTQSSNCVPTTGSSASEALHKQDQPRK